MYNKKMDAYFIIPVNKGCFIVNEIPWLVKNQELIPSFHLEINLDTRKKFNNKFLILFCSSANRYEEKRYGKPTQLKHNELSTYIIHSPLKFLYLGNG